MGKIVNPQIVIVKGGDTPTPPTTGDYFVKVIDFDGTVLKSANLNNGDTFELPAPPSHDGLVFQEWSSSQAITDNKITINNNNVMIGAVYTTASGLNEFDVDVTPVSGLSVFIRMGGTKNWGDGTSSTSGSHTYSAYGRYTITCDGAIGSVSETQTVVNPLYICRHARLSTATTTLGSYAFFNNSQLETITIPNSVTGINQRILQRCPSLKCLIIPSSVSTVSSFCVAEATLANDIVIPYSITTLGMSFNQSGAMKDIAIPKSLSSLPSTTFGHNVFVEKIFIPNSIENIGANCFYGNTIVKEYDFSTFTSVPTLSSTNAFTNINGVCKMKIPSALIDEWKTATNWATYADYMVAV